MATPSPGATPVIEYTELKLGEPRDQPAGYALFSQLRRCFWNCGGGWGGLVRSIWVEQAAELVVDDLTAPLREFGYHIHSAVDETGAVVAAAMCVQGDCGGVGPPSPDARQELWVSPDGGGTWETWGTVPPFSTVARVTEGDVAMRESTRLSGTRFAVQVHWVRSGKRFHSPDTEDNLWVVAWDGDQPIWGDWNPPPHPPALTEVAARTWIEAQTRPDGSAVWYAIEVDDPLLLLAVVDAQGAVEDVYGWPDADYIGGLVPMGEGVFAGFRMEGGWAMGRDHMNFLIDLEGRAFHPLLGLPDEGPWAQPWRAIALTGK